MSIRKAAFHAEWILPVAVTIALGVAGWLYSRRTAPHPVPSPVRVSIAQETIVSGGSGNNPPRRLIGDPFAHDPATDHLWVALHEYAQGETQLNIYASRDAGAALTRRSASLRCYPC